MRSRFVVFPLALAAVSGCNNFLAKNNPCGGIYPADGVAEVFGAKVLGDIELVSASPATYAFNSDAAASGGYGDCSTLVSGLASEDGSQSTSVEVSCPDVTVSFTLPDVRFLDAGARVSLPTNVKLANGSAFDATGSLTIDRAVGAKAPAPTFVTADFLRSGEIDLVPTTGASDAGDGGDAVASSSQVTVHARIDFVAGDYTQAMQAGVDHCPAIPSK